MRVFVAVLVLIFSLQAKSNSKNIVIDNLFGVKILDDINKYAKKSNGERYDHLPNIITFEDEFINLERDDDFDSYYIRTDENYKIHNISARKVFVSSFDSFSNDCKIQKSKMVTMLSKFFDVKINKFKNYYWMDPRNKSIYDDSTITYDDNNINLMLSAYCGYYNIDENITSVLFVSWVTEEYFQKHVDGRWTKIEKFDDKFIKIFLSNSSGYQL